MHRRSLGFSALCGVVCVAALASLGLAQPDPYLARLRPRSDKNAVDGVVSRDLVARGTKKVKEDKKETGKDGDKLKILLTSDSHGAWGSAQWPKYYESMPKNADVLIHCGDMSDQGMIHEYKAVLKSFVSHPAKLKIFIGGNHDFTLDQKYMQANGDSSKKPKEKSPVLPEVQRKGKVAVNKEVSEAYEVFNSPEAKAAGVQLLKEGMHSLQVQSAGGKNRRFRIFVSPITPAFHNFAFAYDPKNPASKALVKDRFNHRLSPARIPSGSVAAPHFVITHGPPQGILDQTGSGVHAGDASLRKAIERVKPIFHAFGHIHEGAGVKRHAWKGGADKTYGKEDTIIDLSDAKHAVKKGESTLFLNVAEKDARFKNSNPWRMVVMGWGGVQKHHQKDHNDASRPANKVKNGIRKALHLNEKQGGQ